MSNENVRTTVLVEDIHENTSQELISITGDKLKLVLLDHLKCVENANAWQTPASLIVAIALVLSTSTFKTAFNISADTWQAFFMFLMLAFVVWFIICLLKLRRASSVDDLIAVIKKKKLNLN